MKEPVVISANNYLGMPFIDKVKWNGTRKLYEWTSRAYGFPIFGKRIFHLMDYFLKIEAFYPKRDLSKPTFQLKRVYGMIKGGFGKHLIGVLNKNPLPIVCSFPILAFFAEEHGYKGEIFCRSWAPLIPSKSRINYLAPTKRVKERLKLYGVKDEKITVTGFPIPEVTFENTPALESLHLSLLRRISKLDPQGIYQKKYKELLSLYLGNKNSDASPDKPLTVTFAVGGAGAQSDIATIILKSLGEKIKNGSIKMNLVAGASKKVFSKFERSISELGLNSYKGKTVDIIYSSDKFEYFNKFNRILLETDILWTKPSELSFYVGLGIPIIMTPPLGSQEEYNRAWLRMIGAGVDQNDPRYANEWLFDWLKSGWLAESAMSGFLNAPKKGREHIEDIVLHGKKTEIEDVHLL
jgi:hypothetical protein